MTLYSLWEYSCPAVPWAWRTVPAVLRLVGRVCVINVLTQIVPVVILILVRGLIGPEVAFPSAHATKEDRYLVIRPFFGRALMERPPPKFDP